MTSSIPVTTAPVRVSADRLREFGTRLLTTAGMSAVDASTVADMLVDTSLSGTDSHGVIRLGVYARRLRAGGITASTRITTVRDDGATAVLDGGGGAGHLVGRRAAREARERAERHGVAVVAVRNSNHLGALGWYARTLADNGMIGLVMTNASPKLAPTGGVAPALGNNPLAISVPHPGGPITMDVAQSVVAIGKIRLHKALGQPLPAGWARNADGAPTTDPDAALSGLIEPVGGHKGYAMAFMIDVLCAILSGASSGPQVSGLFALDRPGGVGHLFIAIDVERFVGRAEFERGLLGLIQVVKQVPAAPGVASIDVPGDPEARHRADRTVNGIPLDGAAVTELRGIADEMSVPLPEWLAGGAGTDDA